MKRRGFTLMELLIVILIITILAGLALSALAGATELAREQRTKSIIAKIDLLLQEKYDSYQTRQVPLRLDGSYSPDVRRALLINARRELMRLEMPDRRSDVFVPGGTTPVTPADLDPGAGVLRLQRPSVHRQYVRKAVSTWSETSQGAECLYLILSTMRDGDKSALDFLSSGEVGDYDGDGMREIWDGWGRPIEFLRWAPGYVENAWNGDQNYRALTLQRRPELASGSTLPYDRDPLDPINGDARLLNADPLDDTFALKFLVFSGGSDEALDIRTANPPNFEYSPGMTNNAPDPYFVLADGSRIGEPLDSDADGALSFGDNITNHYQEP